MRQFAAVFILGFLQKNFQTLTVCLIKKKYPGKDILQKKNYSILFSELLSLLVVWCIIMQQHFAA